MMITQLQFDNDLRTKNFQGPGDIVNFLCDKLAQGADGSRIMVPQQIRRDLRADLTVRSDEEFSDLIKINNDGLIKIFQGVRSDLMSNKRQFLEMNSHRLKEFYCEDINLDHIVDLIWAHLQSMRCPHLCPWCGMPCCGVTECNDKFVQGEVPCEDDIPMKHS